MEYPSKKGTKGSRLLRGASFTAVHCIWLYVFWLLRLIRSCSFCVALNYAVFIVCGKRACLIVNRDRLFPGILLNKKTFCGFCSVRHSGWCLQLWYHRRHRNYSVGVLLYSDFVKSKSIIVKLLQGSHVVWWKLRAVWSGLHPLCRQDWESGGKGSCCVHLAASWLLVHLNFNSLW